MKTNQGDLYKGIVNRDSTNREANEKILSAYDQIVEAGLKKFGSEDSVQAQQKRSADYKKTEAAKHLPTIIEYAQEAINYGNFGDTDTVWSSLRKIEKLAGRLLKSVRKGK